MSNKALNKKIYKYAGGFLCVLLLFFIVLAVNKNLYEQKLLKEGIRTEAQVINKYHLKTNTGKIKKSYIELAIFEDTTAIAKQKHKTLKEAKNIHDKIDNLFENFGTKKAAAGNYKTIALSIGLERYGATKIGDWKTYVYLKNELKNGTLLEALQ
jgi:hypothetical protein